MGREVGSFNTTQQHTVKTAQNVIFHYLNCSSINFVSNKSGKPFYYKLNVSLKEIMNLLLIR